MGTKIVRMNGTPVRVPSNMLTDPDTFARTGPGCDAIEPDWPDGTGGMVVCTLDPHPTGPDGLAHIANNGSCDIIAIWWDAPARPNSDDDD